jgi:protein-S-isoprenylcysteine O-methyltransferase Ste14
MALGEGIRTWSAAHLGATARSSSPRAAKLVTAGPYARTRHPIYWGNLALTMGFVLASGAGFPWFPLLAAVGFVALYARHAREEERALASAFPEAHAAYRARVPAGWWRLRPARVPGAGARGESSFRRAARVELATWHAELWLVAGLWLRTRWPAGG